MRRSACLRLLAGTGMMFLIGTLAGDAQTPAPSLAPELPKPPALRREFRGVWLATVANIDWPSKPGLPVETQKAELITLLDRAKAQGFNAIIFQVRPACDALYASTIEPWSAYLTGEMGKAPEPFYDPLTFIVEESHKRGLELHAWFNPYRARQSGATGTIASEHVSKMHPEMVRQYGKSLWLDPGMPEVREYSLNVVLDVVRRYDIDGIHIDDYFYPYKEKDAQGKVIDFPDSEPFNKYVAAGGFLSRDDWRRESVNTFIREMYRQVKAIKPYVKVGISPFGIWRPGNPAQIKGFDAYAELYADSKKWWNEGWCDYLSPQLYWKIEQTAQSYPVLLEWWQSENKLNRHLWPGNFTSLTLPSTASARAWTVREIEYQVRTTRGIAGATGNIHFSAVGTLTTAPDSLGPYLASNVYVEPALIPASPWLTPAGQTPPAAPSLILSTTNAEWKAGEGTAVWQWAVQVRVGDAWQTSVLPSSTTTLPLPSGATAVSVFGVDRYGTAGQAQFQLTAK